MNNKISIIIATYNSSKTLERALKSILKINYDNWECIIVDGLSSDNTIEIIKRYSQVDNRFRFISELDSGIYDAFNKGLDMAKGDWIYYLGSDDIMLPNGIVELLNNSVGCDALYGKNLTLSHNGRRIIQVGGPVTTMKGRMVSHQAIIMKRTLINALGGFDESFRICGDYDLIQRAVRKGITFKFVDTNVAIFDTGGATGGSIRNLEESMLINIKYGLENGDTAYRHFVKKRTKRFWRSKIKYPIMEILVSLFPSKFSNYSIIHNLGIDL